MSYIVVEDFRAGLDSRRSIVAGAPGSLHKIVNAHITRGGDVEKRKAFVGVYNLPAGTFGCQAVGSTIYAFGSIADPGMPAGVTYQRLQHPDGLQMTKLIMSKITDAKVYALAQFSDGRNLPFYDGALVGEWVNGVATIAMASNDALAAHFAAMINLDGKFTAAAVGNVLTVTGIDTAAFTTVATTTNKSGGVNDQAIAIASAQVAVPSVPELLGTGGFRITGGSNSTGLNRIVSVKVNGVPITGPAIDWITSNEVTAQAVATAINDAATSPDFTATASGDQVTIVAPVGSGATYNGSTVTVETAGDVTTCVGGLIVTGGTSGPGVNKVSLIKIDGVTVQGAAAVDWTTDNSVTAGLIAANINSFISSPDYNAFAAGPQVILSALVATNLAPNNLTVSGTLGGNMQIAAVAVSSTVSAVVSGRSAVVGQPQKSTFTFTGTFEPGDKFYLKLGDYIYGADRVGGKNPTALLPLKDKMYISADAILYHSGVSTPTKFNSDAIGSGFINMSSNAGGSEPIVGVGIYRNNVASFTRRNAQIWFVDPDPALNRQIQVLDNVGTVAARSLVSFGDSDVFYLADTGVRSLRVRDTTENVSAYDVGTPIDDYVKAVAKTLTAAQIADAVGAIEPTDGRYWLALGDKLFVFSYFSTSKISAWSVYEPGFAISEMTIKDGQIFVRSGDTIYAYGGLDGDTYDATVAEVVLPYLDGGKPATKKDFIAIDALVEGSWLVSAGSDCERPDAREYLCTIDAATFNQMSLPFMAHGTHAGMRLVTTGSGPAKIGKVVVHYNSAEAD